MVEDAIVRDLDQLGMHGALPIRNVRIAFGHGRVDLLLLRPGDPYCVTLVEVKRASAPEAVSKVIGQLFMYYSGILKLGTQGLQLFEKFARTRPQEALGLSWKSPKLLSGGISPPERAWAALQAGDRLRPEQVQMYIALDGEPHPALREALSTLRIHHGIQIGLLVATKNGIRAVERASRET